MIPNLYSCTVVWISLSARFNLPRTLGLIALLGLLSACSSGEAPPVTIHGPTMGTSYTIKFVADAHPDIDQETLATEIASQLKALNQTFSTYINDSEINRINHQPVDEVMNISAEMSEVLRISLQIYGLSDGAFDPTVGPLVDLWGFGPSTAPGGVRPADTIPSGDDLESARAFIGLESIHLAGDGTLTRLLPVSIDLSAVAKGYAVDRIADLLESHEIKQYMVEIGGEVRVRGRNNRGLPWAIAIEKPVVDQREIFRIMPLVHHWLLNERVVPSTTCFRHQLICCNHGTSSCATCTPA